MPRNLAKENQKFDLNSYFTVMKRQIKAIDFVCGLSTFSGDSRDLKSPGKDLKRFKITTAPLVKESSTF